MHIFEVNIRICQPENFRELLNPDVNQKNAPNVLLHDRGSGWGSGIHYSLKLKPIIHLIKILGYSLK